MTTKQITSYSDCFDLDPDLQTFAMAVAVIVRRLQELPKEDSDVIYELVNDLRSAQSTEDEQDAREAIMEILDQQPVRASTFDLTDERAKPDELRKWIKWVGDKIRHFRNLEGLTQQQLEECTGLPQSHISRIENGKHSPSRMTLEKIAKALKVPLHEFDPNVDEA